MAVIDAAADSSIYPVHVDHLDRPVMMTNYTGTVVWQASYLPFGEVRTSSGPASLNYRFPGQWFMRETGLHYNWHRWYDASTGRYTQPDPIGMPDGPSRCAYALNSPLRFTDPTGLLEQFTFPLNSRPMSELQCECGASFPAFSGFEDATNNPTSASDESRGPIPPGRYYIVDRTSGGRLGWLWDAYRRARGNDPTRWYSLYRKDDLVDDSTLVDGITRGNFRLHPGERSAGCLTLPSFDAFGALRSLLEGTQPGIIPGTNIKYYGTVDVR